MQLLLKDVLDAWSDDTIVDVPGGKHCVYIRLNRMVLYRHDCVPRIIMSLIVETTDNVLQVYWYTDTLEDGTWGLALTRTHVPVQSDAISFLDPQYL